MAQYGVGTANPYDLLDEDAPKKVDKAPEQAKPAAPAPTKAPEQSRTLDASNKRGGAFPRGRGRGGRGFGRGMGNRAPRRVFERHSGTGRGKEVRKGGYGGYDAEGTIQDDMKAEEVAKQLTLEDAKPAVPAADAAAAPGPVAPEQKIEETEEEKKAREEAEKEAAREASMLSFDQFMELKKKKAVEDDLKQQTRQVEIDENKFKACKKFEKTDDDDYADVLGTSGDADSTENKKKDGKTKKVKHLDEVLKELGGPQPQARSAPSSDFRGGRGRGRGGFGQRGGFGSRGGYGGPRGGFGRGRAAGAPPMQPVDVKSDADFPKLGK